MPLISISLLEQLLCKPLRARVALTRTRKQQHERARPHKRQQGQSKWQSYSEGWKPHNTPHCLSANRFAPCHFPLQTHEGERKLFFFCFFLPLTFPLILELRGNSSPLLFLVSLLLLSDRAEQWHTVPVGSARLFFCHSLTHRLQISFISTPIFK